MTSRRACKRVITQHKRQQKGDSGPTLRKRESPDQTSTTQSGQQQPPIRVATISRPC